MAVLVLTAMILAISSHRVQAGEPPKVAIFYDLGSPDNSVAVINDEIYEVGGLYRQYRILSFEPEAVILEDLETRDSVEFLSEAGETLNPELVKRARHFFVVKQMKKIYEAQVRYFHDYGEGYAADLDTLIRGGYLSDGFSEFEKQGYFFRVEGTEKEFAKEPAFQAVAEPGEPLKPDLTFYINELGDVHYGDTLKSALWGPVWDYREPSTRPISRYIGVEES